MNCQHEFIGENTLKYVLESAIEQIVRYKQLQGVEYPPQYLESESVNATEKRAV